MNNKAINFSITSFVNIIFHNMRQRHFLLSMEYIISAVGALPCQWLSQLSLPNTVGQLSKLDPP
jgi:hypothetical protein